jgi:hypothetical protein
MVVGISGPACSRVAFPHPRRASTPWLGSLFSANLRSFAEQRERNVSTVTKPSVASAEPVNSSQSERESASRLAQQLSPQERHVLVRAGSPRWLGLPFPWQPCSGPQEAIATALASPAVGLLEPMRDYLGAYELTHLGEVVAGVWLLHTVRSRYAAGEPW